MARVGELESIVENLVGRGLVAPKFVGRSVGQAAIDELKGLGSELQGAAGRRQQEQQNKLQQVSSAAMENASKIKIGPTTEGLRSIAKDLTKPFVVGAPHGGNGTGVISGLEGRQAVAMPSSAGFQIRSLMPNDPLLELARKNTNVNDQSQSPLDTIFMGSGTFKTLADLRNRLLTTAKDPAKLDAAFGTF